MLQITLHHLIEFFVCLLYILISIHCIMYDTFIGDGLLINHFLYILTTPVPSGLNAILLPPCSSNIHFFVRHQSYLQHLLKIILLCFQLLVPLAHQIHIWHYFFLAVSSFNISNSSISPGVICPLFLLIFVS